MKTKDDTVSEARQLVTNEHKVYTARKALVNVTYVVHQTEERTFTMIESVRTSMVVGKVNEDVLSEAGI